MKGVLCRYLLWLYTLWLYSLWQVTEMKGPGARGVTPVLRPGDSWQYESGTRLDTSYGAMHGSFQLETLHSVSPGLGLGLGVGLRLG